MGFIKELTRAFEWSEGPPEPSPGLSEAMPWVKRQYEQRPEGAREVY
jgi:hypothetical protein